MDITTTATLRPDILNKTFHSLKKNLSYSGIFKLIINIDPVGDNYTQQNIIDICNRYYTNVIGRVPDKCNFYIATRWTWENVTSDFFLQWQDDWTLDKNVNLSYLKSFMRKHPEVGYISFDRTDKGVHSEKNGGRWIYTGHQGLWEAITIRNLGGPPAIVSKKFAQQFIPHLSDNEAIDNISRKDYIQEMLKEWKFFVYAGFNNEGSLVTDIGRQWRIDRNLKSVKNHINNERWIKKDA